MEKREIRAQRMAVIGNLDRQPERPLMGVSGHSTRSAPERPELSEGGTAALWTKVSYSPLWDVASLAGAEC